MSYSVVPLDTCNVNPYDRGPSPVASPGDKDRPRFGGWHGKPPVIGREKLLGEIPVGRCHRGDPGQRQFFGQPILQGAEDTF